jgi:PIN domain
VPEIEDALGLERSRATGGAMSPAVHSLIQSFDHLPESDKRTAASEPRRGSNVLFGAFISGKELYRLLFTGQRIFLPDLAFLEIEKYKQRILTKTKLDELQFQEFVLELLRHVTVVPALVLSRASLEQAYEHDRQPIIEKRSRVATENDAATTGRKKFLEEIPAPPLGGRISCRKLVRHRWAGGVSPGNPSATGGRIDFLQEIRPPPVVAAIFPRKFFSHRPRPGPANLS